MSAVPQFPAANDPDSLETQEWLDALEAVLEREGPERAHFLLERLVDKARRSGAYIPFSANTAYINTIPTHLEERSPGDAALEERIRSYCRWNAMVMVVRANRSDDELGGHIASFASVGTMFGIGQNHFWHAPHEGHGGDLVYFQGHSSPGVYARALLEGRMSEEQLNNFRREVDGKGISSYPHPWLMPDYWQFPTVSMGLGPIQGIYMARYLKYLEARGLAQTANRKVWVFCGDGEMDEPESMGAIGMAVREKLDNLVFVINCNLQRLDGPVRGNGQIIQELEAAFRGAGWNVIKCLWGSDWDPLFEKDTDGLLVRRWNEVVDGDEQPIGAVSDQGVRPLALGGDHRQTVSPGLDHHIAQRLVARGKDAEVGGPVEGRGVGPPAEEPHAVGDPEGGGLTGLEPGSQLVAVRLYGPVGGTIERITLNGEPLTDVETIVHDNRPTDVQSAVDFVFGDFDGQIVIPGAVFNQAGTAYGIVIAGLDSAPNSGISTNLNIVSRFYAGSATTAIVVTDP